MLSLEVEEKKFFRGVEGLTNVWGNQIEYFYILILFSIWLPIFLPVYIWYPAVGELEENESITWWKKWSHKSIPFTGMLPDRITFGTLLHLDTQDRSKPHGRARVSHRQFSYRRSLKRSDDIRQSLWWLTGRVIWLGHIWICSLLLAKAMSKIICKW
jgi:hypothetical protein